MVIRSLVIAALFVGAGSAHATPTSSTASMLSGWTLQSGSVSVVGTLNSLDAIIASGNLAAWNMHTSLAAQGAASGNSAVLFAPNATGKMSNVGFASSAASVAGGNASGGGALTGGGSGASGGAGGGATGGAGGNGGAGDGATAGAGNDVSGGVSGDASGSLILPDAAGGLALDVGAPLKGSLNHNLDAGAGVGNAELAAEIPEPGSIALLLAGLAGAGFVSRRRSR